MFPLDDTIAAIASPPGGAARGIVRLSGPQAIEIVAGLFGPLSLRERARVRAFGGKTPRSRLLPESLPVRSACRGFTRRCLATSICGAGVSPARMQARRLHHKCNITATRASRWQRYTPSARRRLLELLLRSLCVAGARLAGPGEFTLRAFLAGRIDLTQAEAVLGVIDGGRSAELDVALGQLAGGLARPLHRLRDSLLDLLAHVEAGFDFADEDLTFVTWQELDRRLAEAQAEATAVVATNGLAQRAGPCRPRRYWWAGRIRARAASAMRWPAIVRRWSPICPEPRATI